MLCFGDSIAILHAINNNDYLDLLLSLESSIADAVADIHDLIEDSLEVARYMIYVAIIVLIVEILVIIVRFTLRAGVRMLQILHVVVSMTANIMNASSEYSDNIII